MGMLAGSFFSGEALLSFAPTYNGAQSPSVVADVLSKYRYNNFGPGSSTAGGPLDMTVENSAGDSVINIVGAPFGGPSDDGSIAQNSVDIFNLNTRPDSVGIRLVSYAYTDSDSTNYPSSHSKVGSFTDDSDFDPTNGVLYGYRGSTSVASETPAGNPPSLAETGQAALVIEFTFKKSGYNTLVVTYESLNDANSQSIDIS